MNKISNEVIVHRCGKGREVTSNIDVDPFTTEIVRHSLDSAAKQMKLSLMRTAYSPIIYEVLDFAIALFDRRMQMLSQAPGLALFMGSLSFCVENAVAMAGGPENLSPGDILIHNWPYDTGTHPNDVSLIMPIFQGDTLIGYGAVKAHWLDVGGKEPYATDTIDVFQEGVFFPALKLYKKGKLDPEVERLILINNRMPKIIAGDMNSQIVCLHTGANELVRLVERFGLDVFDSAVERMYDHGEELVKQYFKNLPDGRYSAFGQMDDNGLSPEPVPFEVIVEIEDSTIRIDFSNSPEQQAGPINCPLPQTISGARVAIANIVDIDDSPNEGHFRAIEIITRRKTMFHPEPPAPCFLCVWPSLQAIEVVFKAVSKAMPEAVPAGSGCDLCGFVIWGQREETGEPWADAQPFPIGAGASMHGDGSTLMHASQSATRLSPVEVWELKNPWRIETMEFNPNTCGAGMHQGGMGLKVDIRLLEEARVTPVFENTKQDPFGLAGGKSASPNRFSILYPDGSKYSKPKGTGVKLPKGSIMQLRSGGGGGYGNPEDRSLDAIESDLKNGLISISYIEANYPQFKKF